MKEAAGRERPLFCDGGDEGKCPATERHGCRPAPNNVAESSPTALRLINLLKIGSRAVIALLNDRRVAARCIRDRRRTGRLSMGPITFNCQSLMSVPLLD